jgi:hypothetical protein
MQTDPAELAIEQRQLDAFVQQATSNPYDNYGKPST